MQKKIKVSLKRRLVYKWELWKLERKEKKFNKHDPCYSCPLKEDGYCFSGELCDPRTGG